MSTDFVHLHLHSEYSISDGLLRIPGLIEETARHGMSAVALTDLDNLFAVVKFYNAAVARGIKPIIGCELHVHADDPDADAGEVVLLCLDEQGYRNLTRLVSKAYLEGQQRGVPRIMRSWLQQASGGLLALSGGMRGEIGRALLRDDRQQLARALSFWTELFPGRYYIELHSTGCSGEAAYLASAIQLAKKNALPVVATNDVRFLTRDDFESHEVKVCISQGYALSDERRPRIYSPEQYLKSPAEMAALFGDVAGALENSVEIARRCTVRLELGTTTRLPEFPLSGAATVQEQLVSDAEAGLQRRLAEIAALHRDLDPERYRRRLRSELEIIQQMGYEGYFLIVADFIAWAKCEGVPVGPGRGSGTGSLVAWVLGITGIDPIEYDLLFERFLNPERISMPDFDIDFCIEGRDRVIQYVVERYGRDRVSQIITFGSLGAKAVVRDVGRVLGHPYGFVDKIAKQVPFRLNITLTEALAESQELHEMNRSDERVRQIIDVSKKLEGLARNPGKHAGGVVISPQPLMDYTALYCEPDGSNVVTHFDMNDIEKIGLVKFDFLGLKTLTIIAKAFNSLHQRGFEKMDAAHIPLDDDKTYRLLQRAETAAVFQLESDGIRRLMKSLQPDEFDDVVALVALYRPGPLQSGMSDDYVERKHGAEVRYPHPDVKPILKPTYGVILYQEQVMQIARVLANYTLGAADILRRAMGKKIPSEMAKQRQVFVSGAVARGVDKRVAVHIFDLMEKFADYGFNKSHSVAYAMIAYQTAWLKANHPAAFMSAVMSAEMDDTDKIVYLIDECRQMGLRVEPPDVNRSEYEFTETGDGAILYGLGAVRNVGAYVICEIVEERRERKAYLSLADFCSRLVTRVKKAPLEYLIRAGTFDSIEKNRGALLYHLAGIYSLAERRASDRDSGQASLFGETRGAADPLDFPMPQADEHISREQLLKMERDSLGLYLTDHPVARYRREIRDLTGITLHEARNLKNDFPATGREEPENRYVAGVIMNISVRQFRRGKAAFFVLDDGSGRLELGLFDKDYQNYADMLSHDDIVVVKIYRSAYNAGRENGRWRAGSIMTLDQARRHFSKTVCVSINVVQADAGLVGRIEESLAPFVEQGGRSVIVLLRNAQAVTRLLLGEQWKVTPCEEMLRRLQRIGGVEEVAVNYH